MSQPAAASQAHTNQAFYDRISRAYDLISDAGESDARNQGIDALDLKPGETVLDVGFGTGSAVIEIANRLGADGEVFGIDISPGMQEVAEEKAHSAGIKAVVKLSVGDARKLPHEDDTFDAAFTSFTLELFPLDEIPTVLGEIKRVLKPGGRLGVVSMATVQPNEQESTLEHIYKWMHRHFPHIVDCQPIELERHITDAGFKIEKDIRLEIWTMPVAAVVATAN